MLALKENRFGSSYREGLWLYAVVAVLWNNMGSIACENSVDGHILRNENFVRHHLWLQHYFVEYRSRPICLAMSHIVICP